MKLRDDLNALLKARAEYHAKAHTLTPPQIAVEVLKFKKLNQAIVDKLTDGAKDCPDCGRPPHGMFHDGTANPFEVGCLNCAGHRIREALPEDAVVKWNAAKGGAPGEAGGYLPTREAGTVLATHRDVTGKVKSERLVKVRVPNRK